MLMTITVLSNSELSSDRLTTDRLLCTYRVAFLSRGHAHIAGTQTISDDIKTNYIPKLTTSTVLVCFAAT